MKQIRNFLNKYITTKIVSFSNLEQLAFNEFGMSVSGLIYDKTLFRKTGDTIRQLTKIYSQSVLLNSKIKILSESNKPLLLSLSKNNNFVIAF